ncbi:MAG: ester cyclase [Thermoleophilia bacterium]|nr:ester cyclase [Thermoleophilia bacterium]
MHANVVDKRRETINRHDAEAFAALYAADAVVTDPMYPEPLRGSEAVEKDIADFVTAFPDLEASFARPILDGTKHAFEITMNGTHTGPLIGPDGEIPATNRTIELPVGVFATLDEDGRIREERRYYDVASLLGQLGLTQ